MSYKNNKSRGIGLLELILSLAIIGSILLMATRYYLQAQEGAKVAQATKMISTLVNASFKWLEANDDFNDLKNKNILVDANILPESWRDKKNPWAGLLEVVGYGADSQRLKITLGGLSETACENIDDIMSKQGMQLNKNCADGSYVGIYPEIKNEQ